MPKRNRTGDPEELRVQLVELLSNFERELRHDDLRVRVRALVPVAKVLQTLGASLIPADGPHAARDRILKYLIAYPLTVIEGEELMVVAGISEWARRVRELRVQFGWSIVTGVTVKHMREENEGFDGFPVRLRTDQYVLLDARQDRGAAHRWNLANAIRKKPGSVQSRILDFFRANCGQVVTGEELRYVANNKSEWARRVRELRTEQGWPIVTRWNGRPDLPVGHYLLEEDRQSYPHDRAIPDPVRREVLVRDGYMCRKCRWSRKMWNPDDPRHLELHHLRRHADGGENTADNLITCCNVCHDAIHVSDKTD